MSSEDFDPNDMQDFDEPSFPEDAEFMPPEATSPQRPPRNRRFIIIALLLVLVFLIALGVGASAIIEQQRITNDYLTKVQAVYLTNTAVQIALNATGTAKAWTPTPTATYTPTFTQTPTATPTETATATSTPTATVDIPGTQTAQAQTQTAQAQMQAIDITNTAIAQLTLDAARALTETASAPTQTLVPGAPTLSDVDMTETALALTLLAIPPVISPTLSPSPSAAAGTEGTAGTLAPTTPAKTALITASANPKTGLFDDMGLGANGSAGGLGIVGLAALALVGVIVMARVLRAKT